MRIYKTPILTTEEQKIIGGKLSLRQFAYVLGGGLVSFSLAKTLYTFIGFISIALCAAVFCIFLLLAFYKVRRYEINLDRFFVLRLKYAFSQKRYRYERGWRQ